VEVKYIMKKETQKVVKSFTLILQLGLNVIACLIVSCGLGYIIDRKFDTKCWFIVFLILGIITAYRNCYIMLKGFYTKDKSSKQKQYEYIQSLTRDRKRNGK